MDKAIEDACSAGTHPIEIALVDNPSEGAILAVMDTVGERILQVHNTLRYSLIQRHILLDEFSSLSAKLEEARGPPPLLPATPRLDDDKELEGEGSTEGKGLAPGAVLVSDSV